MLRASFAPELVLTKLIASEVIVPVVEDKVQLQSCHLDAGTARGLDPKTMPASALG
jgi:hypothetical protein